MMNQDLACIQASSNTAAYSPHTNNLSKTDNHFNNKQSYHPRRTNYSLSSQKQFDITATQNTKINYGASLSSHQSKINSNQENSSQSKGEYGQRNHSRSNSHKKEIVVFKQRILQGKAMPINQMNNQGTLSSHGSVAIQNTNYQDNQSTTQMSGTAASSRFARIQQMRNQLQNAKPSYFTFKRPLTHSFSSQLLSGQKGDGRNSNIEDELIIGQPLQLEVDIQHSRQAAMQKTDYMRTFSPQNNQDNMSQLDKNNSKNIMFSMKQLDKLHHFTQYGQWSQTHSRVPMNTYQKGRFAFKTGGYPLNNNFYNKTVQGNTQNQNHQEAQEQLQNQVQMKEFVEQESLSQQEDQTLRETQILPIFQQDQSLLDNNNSLVKKYRQNISQHPSQNSLSYKQTIVENNNTIMRGSDTSSPGMNQRSSKMLLSMQPISNHPEIRILDENQQQSSNQQFVKSNINSMNSKSPTNSEPVMNVKVIYNNNKLEIANDMKKSRQAKRNYLKQTLTTQQRQVQNHNHHLQSNLFGLNKGSMKDFSNLPLINDFRDLIQSQYHSSNANKNINNLKSRSNSQIDLFQSNTHQPLLQCQNSQQSLYSLNNGGDNNIYVNQSPSKQQLNSPNKLQQQNNQEVQSSINGQSNVYGKLFIVSNKIKHIEEYQRVIDSKNYHQYKILLMKNKIKVMDKYLSQLKPIVCLNSIRSIYKKQSESNEQLTRKRILMKYLERLFDQKIKDYFGGMMQKEDQFVPEHVKKEVIMTLVENILSGQLDSEDDYTEKVIDDILCKYGLKKPPRRLFD
eukprot:403362575